jgi:O-antigen ligase
VSIRLKLLFLLTGCFVLLSPISLGQGSTISEVAKYMRLSTTMLIVGVGFATAPQLRLGNASRALFAFVVLFVLSATWSDSPLWGLFNKGMFGLTCLSGVILAGSLRTSAEMRSGLRFLGFIAGGAAIVALVVFIKNPSATSSQDRMAIFGLNPNLIGHTASPLAVLCMYVAMNDRRRIWKILMVGACCILGLIIIATGCRGAALTLMIGSACLLAPSVRRPGVLFGALSGAALIAFIGFEVMDIGGNDRMVNEIGKNTRTGVWSWALRHFARSPLIGCGWMHFGSHSATVQSMYMQVLAETGIVGALLLFIVLLTIAKSWIDGLLKLKRLHLPTNACSLALSLLMVELAHGLTESSPVVGTMLSALNLGLSVGLTDRVANLAETSRTTSTPLVASSSIRRRPSPRQVLEAMQQNQRNLPVPPQA